MIKNIILFSVGRPSQVSLHLRRHERDGSLLTEDHDPQLAFEPKTPPPKEKGRGRREIDMKEEQATRATFFSSNRSTGSDDRETDAPIEMSDSRG